MMWFHSQSVEKAALHPQKRGNKRFRLTPRIGKEALTSGRRASEELGVPMADDRAGLGKLHSSAGPDHDDHGSHHRDGSRRVQRNAQRAMIGIALGHMVVGHLYGDQQRQQDQTQQSDRPESAWLLAAILAIICRQCGQINQPLFKGYTGLDAAAWAKVPVFARTHASPLVPTLARAV
jgi:hypothetical protein